MIIPYEDIRKVAHMYSQCQSGGFPSKLILPDIFLSCIYETDIRLSYQNKEVILRNIHGHGVMVKGTYRN
jgi:hypothetical protein